MPAHAIREHELIDDDLIDQEAVARLLSVRSGTVAAWRIKNTGPPYIKVAGLIRYSRRQLEQYVRQHRVHPGVRR